MYHKDSAYDDFCNAFQLDVTNFKYKYTIENFSQRSENTDEEIISPTFVVGSKERSEWCLHIYPNGTYYSNDVEVDLILLKPDKVHAKVKFAILNDKEEEKHVNRYFHTAKKHFGIEHIYFETGNHGNKKPYDVFYTNQTDNYFKYIYTIENFSLRPEKTGEKIISPTFGVGSKERSEWCLHIYPNGKKYLEGKVLVYLVLLKPDEVAALCKCSFLNNRGEEKFVDTKYESFWRGCESLSYDCSIKRDSLLNESNDLLFNDKLTILCEAKITELEYIIYANFIPCRVLYISQTDVYNFKYKYTIQNFSLRPEKTGEKIISPTFVVGSKERSEWCLHIYPNGQDEDSKEFISVYLTLLKPDKAKAKYRFSILNNKQREKNVKFVSESENFVKDIGLGFSQFVKKDFLLERSNSLLFNDKLTIQCEAEIFELESENRNYPETLLNIPIPPWKSSLDYENLYDPSSFYDCVIKVEDKEFKVHKTVLAARSSVFHDIFTSASDESQIYEIKIKDFNVEVVEKMLKYIYTGEVSDIQNMANQMFEIANKYELDRLKSISEQSMCNSLNTDNVLERFALSDKYPTERLKECCEELILKNIECVTTTKEWEYFVLLHPSLIGNLFSKLVKIISKESNSEKKE
uniref:Speckle-type POZ protein-like (inferred by orthology to a human protein) n=1 Tax=Strongyloides venezuelensis TaxID=75913 RepID=A0A0K0EWN4_STRVS